jgi:acyl carrier protein
MGELAADDTLAESVATTLAESLGLPPSSLDEAASAFTCEAWDSLAQLRLVLALEERFAIRFTIEEIERATSLAEVRRLVAEKVAKRDRRA